MASARIQTVLVAEVGIGGKGSEGVTGLVKQSPGAIGYIELTNAEENKLPCEDPERGGQVP